MPQKVIIETTKLVSTMDKEKARSEIAELVEKYNKVVEENRVKEYNEEMTKIGFIQPLFRALGWNFQDSKEVTAEETISKKRVDYGFRIDGIPKFYLEAKSLKADLDKEEYFEQAISYAWHKGCTWAVLTDFEAVKILNAEWKAANYLQSHFTTITYDDFLERFDELWLLSKESFEKGLLDETAERRSKKTKKASIDEQLLEDFTKYRRMLTKSITKLNVKEKLSKEELDESVQRILDRLIFIRNCEDKELEEKLLISKLREWRSRGRGKLVKGLREIFSYFDEHYDSKIFTKHLCDQLEIDNEILSEIIKGLYFTKEKYFSISYDFSVIDADVLGNIYEQYLSHILKKTAKRARVTKNGIHRKEQGIYYTPTYIVDYIVRNTLGKILEKKKVNVEEIRVLDPACGSGSFLIKAFDIFDEYYKKNIKDYSQTQLDKQKIDIPFTKKAKILQDNIFGVDLDKQAVEIAQLNLLLKIAEKGHRLPLLEESIRRGNSIIDDENIAGNIAFRWEDEFDDIMKEGGFDVVIGNPPYVRVDNLKIVEKTYWKDVFSSAYGKYDIYYLFIESVFKWLQEGGKCGFILPNKFCAASSAEKLREIIVKNSSHCTIISVSHLDIFKEAANYPVLLFLTKGKNVKRINIGSVSTRDEFLNKNFVNYWLTRRDLEVLPSKIFPINISQEQFDIVIKLLRKCDKLSKYLKISEGLRIPTTLEENIVNDFEILKQYQFDRYSSISKGSYITKNNLKKVISTTSKRYVNSLKRKIVIAEDALRITATMDYEKRIPQGGVYFGVLKNENTSLEYILGLLNSKLVSFVYFVLFGGMHMGGGYLRYRTKFLEELPIKVAQESEQTLIQLVNRMLSLKARVNQIGDKMTDERARLEKEMDKINCQIDELVYKIYGITEKEQRIIEGNL